jgi:hypothetical protein
MVNPFTDDMERTPPQTEDSQEQGLVRDEEDARLGQPGSLDPDDTGDIADEGPGHRG